MNDQDLEEEKQLHPIFKIIKDKPKANPNRLTWSKGQDESLRQLVEQYHGHNWKRIGEEMKIKYPDLPITGKKCRERWITSGKDGLNRLPLTNSEDFILIMMHHKYNNKWAAISRQMPGRNPSCLKNNFYSLVKKLVRQAKFGKEESSVSPFKFFSTLYIIMFLLEATETQNPETKRVRGIPHISLYAIKLNITSKICRARINNIKQGFVSTANGISTRAIENLKALTFDNMKKFLSDMLTLIPEYIKSYSPDQVIIRVIEELIGNPVIPPPPPLLHFNTLPMMSRQPMLMAPQFMTPTYFGPTTMIRPNMSSYMPLPFPNIYHPNWQ